MNLEKYEIKLLLETICVREISDDEYFSSKYKQYCSNSKLKLINPEEGGHPLLYQKGIESKYNSSFEFGTAVHQLLLQPNEFVLSEYNLKPSAKLGLFMDKFINIRNDNMSIYDTIIEASNQADYYKGKMTEKKIRTALEKGFQYYIDVTRNNLKLDELGREVIVLSEKVKNDVSDAVKASWNNHAIRRLLTAQNFAGTKEFYNEQALFVDILVTFPNGTTTIIPFKLKLDNYSIDEEEATVTLNDVKTTGKPVGYFMGNFIDVLDDNNKKIDDLWLNGSFQNFHYYRQMGVYLFILQNYCRSVLNLQKYQYNCNMLVVESTPEFKSNVFPVSQAYINKGLVEFKELICRVAWHEVNGYDKEINEDE